MRKLTCLPLLFVTFVLAGCNAVHVTSDWDPNVDFGALTTWSFESSDAAHPVADRVNQDDFTSDRIAFAIRRNLEGKGYREARSGEAASFHVRHHLVVNSEMSIAKLNSYAGYGNAGVGTGVSLNSGFGLSEDPFVDHYMQDTLFIDIADAGGSRLIWRGSGSCNRADSGSANDQARVDERVDSILADFPPGR